MYKKEINSIAILELFHIIPINFLLFKSNSFIQVLIFINSIINKIYDYVAIYNSFNNITTKFYSVSLFFNVIFNLFLSKSKNNTIIRVGKTRYGFKSLANSCFFITNLFYFKQLLVFFSSTFNIFKSLLIFLKTSTFYIYTYFNSYWKLFFDFFKYNSFSFRLIINFILIDRERIIMQ